MNKEELIKIFEEVGVEFNEGIQNDKKSNLKRRIVFWDYIWEPVKASGELYNTNVTYQISYFSIVPRDKKLIELRNRLLEKGQAPIIEHEYIEEKKVYHSFFAIEVLENIE